MSFMGTSPLGCRGAKLRTSAFISAHPRMLAYGSVNTELQQLETASPQMWWSGCLQP